MMTEQWKDLPGSEGKYQVSTYGNVRRNFSLYGTDEKNSLLKGTIVKRNARGQGYILYDFRHLASGRRRHPGHRLVAATFLGLDIADKSIVVCHKDDNPSNNRLDNLYMGTVGDNMRDKFRNKVRVDLIGDIRSMIKEGLTDEEIYNKLYAG